MALLTDHDRGVRETRYTAVHELLQCEFTVVIDDREGGMPCERMGMEEDCGKVVAPRLGDLCRHKRRGQYGLSQAVRDIMVCRCRRNRVDQKPGAA